MHPVGCKNGDSFRSFQFSVSFWLKNLFLVALKRLGDSLLLGGGPTYGAGLEVPLVAQEVWFIDYGVLNDMNLFNGSSGNG